MTKSIGSSSEAQTSQILGVDFGKSKIGLAIADEETKMAFALDTLANDKYFIETLKEIIDSRGVKTIVVGMVVHKNDPEGALEKQRFGEMIEKETGKPVFFQDESFTTKMAQTNIKMRGGRNIAKTDDQEAARIILQSWLDRDNTFEQSMETLKSTRPS